MVSFLYHILVPMPSTVIFALFGTIVISLFRYLMSFTSSRKEAPRLYYKETPLNKFVIKRCSRLTSPFRLNFWVREAHVQTIASVSLPLADVHFKREYIKLNDGGVIALDWEQTGCHLDKERPILFVLPGLTGDAQGMGHLCLEAVKRGYRSVVFNKRGHGGSYITTPKLQSFGDPSDVREALGHIKALYPAADITAIGSSAGSGLLVSYLGEYGASTYLTTGVCISPGYDADALFSGGVKQPYDWILLTSLKKLLSEHKSILSKAIDVKAALQSRKLIEFEESVYSKLYGFANMKEYWASNNPMRALENTAIPVMSISSLDDPVCSKDLICYDMFTEYPDVILVTPKHGGHCGFFEGPKLERWADKTSLDYIDAVLEFNNKIRN